MRALGAEFGGGRGLWRLSKLSAATRSRPAGGAAERYHPAAARGAASSTAALDAAAAKTTQGTIGADAIAALRATAPSGPGPAPVNPATGEYVG
ncbi:hypothetical protein [Rhodobacter capsulatus]|uniref:hypothetical protein n=1 Tax=Rhodobacter capsulatus TaxID=1061 RepID=UPI0040262924